MCSCDYIHKPSTGDFEIITSFYYILEFEGLSLLLLVHTVTMHSIKEVTIILTNKKLERNLLSSIALYCF